MRPVGIACIVIAAVSIVQLTARPQRVPGLPPVMLWAWETPQDLRFIHASSVGIAFLERTISVSGQTIRTRPRLDPLQFNPGVPLMAVVRIESAGAGLPEVPAVAQAILPAAKLPDLRALQIDFDARQSEQGWYTALLRNLRSSLPAKLPLTITALENWCGQDGWLSGLPIADATAMLFRMGPEDRRLPTSFASPACRSSIGVSTDELPVHVPRADRIYFFHPGPWSEESYDAALAQVRRWHL